MWNLQAVIQRSAEADGLLLRATEQPVERAAGQTEVVVGFEEAKLVGRELPLGAKLYAARSGDLLARLGEPYDPRPDQVVLPIPDSGIDEVLEAALAWLREQDACPQEP